MIFIVETDEYNYAFQLVAYAHLVSTTLSKEEKKYYHITHNRLINCLKKLHIAYTLRKVYDDAIFEAIYADIKDTDTMMKFIDSCGGCCTITHKNDYTTQFKDVLFLSIFDKVKT